GIRTARRVDPLAKLEDQSKTWMKTNGQKPTKEFLASTDSLSSRTSRFFYRHLAIRAFEGGLKRRKAFRYWNELERTQWASAIELQSIQFDALKRLLSNALANCPFYRKVWSDLGLDPAQSKSPEDFRRWPVIDRGTINENRLWMRNEQWQGRLLAKSTGGSSGIPLHFDYDTTNLDWRMAAWHRVYSWGGAGSGTKQLYLWGIALGKQPWRTLWKNRLYNRLYRRRILNSFDLSEERVPWILEQINRYRPENIVAYSNPLYMLARFLDDRKL